ncbi:MAG: hypothetical protein ACI8X5_000038 [Planctomycetota bacterium]|jgi:hypothetical protein
MDLNDYWQENKRFVLTVVGGVIVFCIGNAMINSFIGDELRALTRTKTKVEKDLRASRFTISDQNMARVENEGLSLAIGEMSPFVGYPTRPEFTLDASRGSAGNQYFAVGSRVREDILRRAGRINIRVDQDLGLPSLAPTRDDEIARHLDGLDLVERVIEFAIEERVERVSAIDISLDSGLRGSKGVGHVEETLVKMKMSGHSRAILRLLSATQEPANGQPILIKELEIVPERTKEDEVRMEVTFAAVRLHEIDTEEEL